MKKSGILAAAGGVMLLGGVIFAILILSRWMYAALLGAGGLCCLAGALNGKSEENG